MQISTKLNIPQAVPFLIERQRLKDQLENGLAGKVTYVSAPAGSGKTTLISSCLQECDRKVVWYSLDESDNDIRQFFAYVVDGFRKTDPGFGKNIRSALSSENEIIGKNIIIEMINELVNFTDQYVLVLDDFHFIHSMEIQKSIELLVKHIPDNLHLIILSRATPGFSTHNLKLHHQLTEITAKNLCFNREETKRYYQKVAKSNPKDNIIDAIELKTEGWIAAIQLIIKALCDDNTSDFLQKFSGKQESIMEYLMEEVIKRIPSSVLDFLESTAMFQSFCVSLCDFLDFGEKEGSLKNSEQIIDYLKNHNLFLIPLDDSGTWYRYHHLFSDFLKDHFSDHKKSKHIYSKAAKWFEENNQIEQAIEYALMTNDNDYTAQLIESVSLKLLKNHQLIQLGRWFEKLTEECLEKHPLLCIVFCVICVWRNDKSTAEHLHQIALKGRHYMPDLPMEIYLSALKYSISSIYSFSIIDDNKIKELITFLEGRPDEFSVFVLCCSMYLSALNIEKKCPQDGVQLYIKIMQLTRRTKNFLILQSTIISYASLLIQMGKLGKSMDVLRECHDYLNFQNQKHSDQNLEISIDPQTTYLFSIIYYEQNELTKAEDLLNKSLNPLIKGKSDHLSVIYCLLAIIADIKGETDKALALLKNATHYTDIGKYETGTFFNFRDLIPGKLLLFSRNKEHRTLLEDVEADLNFAVKKLNDENQQDVSAEFIQFQQARLHYFKAEYDQAIKLINPIIDIGKEEERYAQVIQYTVLLCSVLTKKNKHMEARNHLDIALVYGEKEGFIRSFVDGGPEIEELLREGPDFSVPDIYINDILSAFAKDHRNYRNIKSDITSQDFISPKIKNIQNREIHVIVALEKAMSDKEIAQELHMSIHTVRSYLKSIYRKLNVHSRMEAVQKAKTLGIIAG